MREPSIVEGEMGSGQGPDQEGSCEGGRETDLDAESNNWVRARWLLCEEGHWLGRIAGRKQGWEWLLWRPGSRWSENAGKCRMGRLSRHRPGPEDHTNIGMKWDTKLQAGVSTHVL